MKGNSMKLSTIILAVFVTAILLFGGTNLAQAQGGTYDIYVVDVKSGEVTKVTHIDDAAEYNPSFSNNGKQVAHDVVGGSAPLGHSIYITDVSSGVSTFLAGADGGNDASWSPDGKYIALDRVPAGDYSIYVVPAGGGTRTLVRANAVDAEWSNNSNRLVFQDGDGSLRTVDLAGGTETSLGVNGVNPSWSPNGKAVAYSDGDNIFTIAVDEAGVPQGSPVQVTHDAIGAYDQQPSWSNNSKTIVFHSARGGGDFDIWTVSASGGTPSRLTGFVGSGDYDPSYSKNGELVAFAGYTPALSKSLAGPGAGAAGSVPAQTSLDQNYPNPFNPTTMIHYGLNADASVTLSVYDVLGRRVAELVSGQVAAGSHEVVFNATNLSSGIYFYRLNVNDANGKSFTQVRRLMLAK
jgi:Tol biopolymer transport system component